MIYATTILQNTVMVLDDKDCAVDVAKALLQGGLPIQEITIRTPAALEAISRIAASVPEVVIGAGTVLNEAQVTDAANAGAMFVVSPGLDASVVTVARKLELPVFPGVSTTTEMQKALNMGVRILNFFPSRQAGGLDV